MAKIGKRVSDDLYIHISALDLLEDDEHRRRIAEALDRLPALLDPFPKVAKLNVRTGRLSLLAYQDFEEDPFPQLAASWTFAPESASPPTFRTYSGSLNPPILHRKELLVSESYPGRQRWSELTSVGESLGLFDDTTTIGFKVNWERLVASKGYRLTGTDFVPLGNDVDDAESAPAPPGGHVQRHLTALSRSALSAPMQLLVRHGLMSQETTVFDYGCGRGGDVACLSTNGFTAHGWDPHYANEQPILEADVVNLGFVVNVIEDPAERVEALLKAFKVARRVMAVSVMLYGSEPTGRPFRDGFITSRNTFQKYFTQGEFKDYVEQVLHQEAFMAGPGVAFVFADKDSEQRFSVARYRTKGIAARLLATRTPEVRVKRQLREASVKQPRLPGPSRTELKLQQARPHLERLWALALDLGRYPEPEEGPHLTEINAQLGGFGKALRLLATHFDQGVLAVAAATRADDLRLYLATQQFSRRPAYRQLEPRLQLDIKAFFGDYRAAQAAGLRLLQDAADPSQLFEACQRAANAGLGWLEGQHSLQLHLSMVERLPVVLRAYVACGLILWNSLSEVQLVKIHIGSGKLTLMEFEEFDTSPLPLLRRRIKVNIRKQDYDLFEYDSEAHPKPLLYWKSRYLHEDYPDYADQAAFDEALEATGTVGSSEFGPAPELLLLRLEAMRLGISGMRLARSERLPDLDQACGKRFTFRSFIECGETQQRLGLNNLPLNPATYNALYDLATQLLDPVADYFGGIRLTYGFCSAELGRHISKRVAPKLDQHAACEVGARKAPICDRLGASCDFVVDDENMREVANWIIANLPFDRLYFYGADRPIHLSYGPQNSRAAYEMRCTASGAVVPRPYPCSGAERSGQAAPPQR
jgi:DNA phosphorothioation-associated putative methyltransferase